MNEPLHVLGYAASGPPSAVLGEAAVELPPVGTRRRAGRLPGLAERLARVAVGERELPAGSGSLFGTRWGCLTETDDVLTALVRENEALPKPRSFSSSVHNAIASHVALALSLTGECQTFVQGETAFAHAAWAAGHAARRKPGAWWLTGALDERPAGSFDGLAAASETPSLEGLEGGGVLLLGPPDGEPRVRLESVHLGRPSNAPDWFDERQRQCDTDIGLVVPPSGTSDPPGQGALAWLPENRLLLLRHIHDASLASACCLAAAWLAGHVSLPGLERPERLAVRALSTRGDAAVLGFAAP